MKSKNLPLPHQVVLVKQNNQKVIKNFIHQNATFSLKEFFIRNAQTLSKIVFQLQHIMRAKETQETQSRFHLQRVLVFCEYCFALCGSKCPEVVKLKWLNYLVSKYKTSLENLGVLQTAESYLTYSEIWQMRHDSSCENRSPGRQLLNNKWNLPLKFAISLMLCH